MPAQLLVSVRSPREADAALAGGAHIIDIKEPRQGSLGRCNDTVISEIVRLVRRKAPELLLSAALGEAREHRAGSQIPIHVLNQPDLLKCGLSGTPSESPRWIQDWQHLRQKTSSGPQNSGPQWVAVSYADAARSCSPTLLEVLEEGRRSSCPVLLIDTFIKDGTSLLDWMTAEQLSQIRHRTREYGMKLALAGSINQTILPQILSFLPDIVAVRGAACEGGERTATISADSVRRLVNAMSPANTVSSSTEE